MHPSTGYGVAGILQDRAAATVDAGTQPRVRAGQGGNACLPPACSCSLVQRSTLGKGGGERKKQIISKVKQHKLMKDNSFLLSIHTKRQKLEAFEEKKCV